MDDPHAVWRKLYDDLDNVGPGHKTLIRLRFIPDGGRWRNIIDPHIVAGPVIHHEDGSFDIGFLHETSRARTTLHGLDHDDYLHSILVEDSGSTTEIQSLGKDRMPRGASIDLRATSIVKRTLERHGFTRVRFGDTYRLRLGDAEYMAEAHSDKDGSGYAVIRKTVYTRTDTSIIRADRLHTALEAELAAGRGAES